MQQVVVQLVPGTYDNSETQCRETYRRDMDGELKLVNAISASVICSRQYGHFYSQWGTYPDVPH